jgi:NAD(P)-dependent dehydrogenase (short-subunit alcohol dehydrogenase family)
MNERGARCTAKESDEVCNTDKSMLGLAIVLAVLASLPYLISVLFTPEYAVPEQGGIVLVTGSGSGIGKSASIALAEKGFVVWAGVRKQEHIDELSKLGLPNLLPVRLDVTSKEDVEKLADSLSSQPLPLVGLVNNAGRGAGMDAVEFEDIEMVRSAFEVNYFAVVSLTSKLLPLLRSYKGSRIVNISSVSGFIALPASGQGYASSKFALECFSDALRMELAPHGVSVSIVQPGFVESAMTNGLMSSVQDRMKSPPTIGSELYAHVYLGARRMMGENCELVRLSPEETTTPAILHALTAPRPKVRYMVANVAPFVPAQVARALKSLLPDRVFDYMMVNSAQKRARQSILEAQRNK